LHHTDFQLLTCISITYPTCNSINQSIIKQRHDPYFMFTYQSRKLHEKRRRLDVKLIISTCYATFTPTCLLNMALCLSMIVSRYNWEIGYLKIPVEFGAIN